MRYVAFAMWLYHAKLYADMEKDFAGIDTRTGASIREHLLKAYKESIQRIHLNDGARESLELVYFLKLI